MPLCFETTRQSGQEPRALIMIKGRSGFETMQSSILKLAFCFRVFHVSFSSFCVLLNILLNLHVHVIDAHT